MSTEVRAQIVARQAVDVFAEVFNNDFVGARANANINVSW